MNGKHAPAAMVEQLIKEAITNALRAQDSVAFPEIVTYAMNHNATGAVFDDIDVKEAFWRLIRRNEVNFVENRRVTLPKRAA